MALALDNGLVFAVLPTWLSPLWRVGVGFVAACAVLVAVAVLLRALAPKVAAIAGVTAKEGLLQPLLFVMLGLGLFLLFVFPFIAYNTLGEDIKMLKSEGVTLIKILAVILGLWTASVSISEELEGRTALTVLSKPVGRRQMIFGKFLGVLAPVAMVFILLGAFFVCTVSYKKVYDARESCLEPPVQADCVAEMTSTMPHLALAFMEAVVLVSISVAISTRLPMLPNLLICAAIYVLGHLVPNLVQSTAGRFEIVQFVGRFLAAILPGLDHFNIDSAMFRSQPVEAAGMTAYLVIAGVYSLLYTAVAMLLALLLFEDRDLA